MTTRFHLRRQRPGLVPALCVRTYCLRWHWRSEPPDTARTEQVQAITVDDATAKLRRQLTGQYTGVTRELAVINAEEVTRAQPDAGL